MWIRPLEGRDDCFRLIVKVGRKYIHSLFFYGDELRPGLPSGSVDKTPIVAGEAEFEGWVEWDASQEWPRFVNGTPMVGEAHVPTPRDQR